MDRETTDRIGAAVALSAPRYSCGSAHRSGSSSATKTEVAKKGSRNFVAGESSGPASYSSPPMKEPTKHPQVEAVLTWAMTVPSTGWKRDESRIIHAVSARDQKVRRRHRLPVAAPPAAERLTSSSGWEQKSGVRPKPRLASTVALSPSESALRVPMRRTMLGATTEVMDMPRGYA
eukprot:scaffold4357_cov113-Isochrysis_galbana.AAC.6